MLFVGPQTGAEYPARNKAYTLHTTASSGDSENSNIKRRMKTTPGVLL